MVAAERLGDINATKSSSDPSVSTRIRLSYFARLVDCCWECIGGRSLKYILGVRPHKFTVVEVFIIFLTKSILPRIIHFKSDVLAQGSTEKFANSLHKKGLVKDSEHA